MIISVIVIVVFAGLAAAILQFAIGQAGYWYLVFRSRPANGSTKSPEQRRQEYLRDMIMREHGGIVKLLNLPVPGLKD